MSPTKMGARDRWSRRLKKGAVLLTATATATLGLLAVTATAASAHTPQVNQTCQALTVDLSNYAASQPGKDAVDPVTKTVYQRYSWTPKKGHHNTETPDKSGSTPLNDPSHWQANTSNYNGSDPVGEVFQQGNGQNSSWFYWTSEVKTIKPGQDAVPPKTNHVSVTINGSSVADTDFSTSYHKTFMFADKTVANSWTVKVTAYDDPSGAKGWTFTKSGTTTPCAPPAPTKYTVSYGDQTCVAGPNNDTVGDVTVTPADAASVDKGKWENGERTVTVTSNKGFAPADGTSLSKGYTDDGSNCGVTPPTYASTIWVNQECDVQNGAVLMSVEDADGKSHGHAFALIKGSMATGAPIDGGMFSTGNDGTLTLDITSFGGGLVAGETYTVVLYEGSLDGTLQDTWTFTVDTCEVTPPETVKATPAAPTQHDVCEPADGTNDTVTIPSDTNFTYTLDGKAVKAGTHSVTGTTAVVKAVAKDGVELKKGAQDKWTFTFTKDACVTPPPVVTPPEFPATPEVCAPAYTLPKDTADFTWKLEGGHVIATRVVDGATHDYGQVPLGDNCPTSPANPGDNGNGDHTNPPATNNGDNGGHHSNAGHNGGAKKADHTTKRTAEAPRTGGVGDTGTEGIIWGLIALIGLGGIGVAGFGLRRRRA